MEELSSEKMNCSLNNSKEFNVNNFSQIYSQSQDELERIKDLSMKIPMPVDFSYFKSFPEFSINASDIVYKTLSTIRKIMHVVALALKLSNLCEIDRLSSNNDYILFNTFISSIYNSLNKVLEEYGIESIDNSLNNPPLYQQKEDYYEFLPYVTSSNGCKCQEKFISKTSTDSKNFFPNLVIKHNAKLPYEPKSYTVIPNMYLLDDYARQIGIDMQNNELHGYINPYSYEINHIEYPDFEDKKPVDEKYIPVEDTPYHIIETEEALDALIETLRTVEMIGFDIREHTYHSYLGFICVLIISTKTDDYIVDAIVLHDVLWKLNEIFTNEKIMKVFSGRDQIITSLQRDFGIYCVNLFSILQAARVLSLPSHCIRKIIHDYIPECDIHCLPSTCDWRIRPLNDYHLKDCRCICHCLIYLSEKMRIELINKSPSSLNLVYDVLARGNETSLLCYEKPLYSYHIGMWIIPKFGLRLQAKKKNIFLSLIYWRDIVARVKDESPRYILPLDCVIQIVNSENANEITRICNRFGDHLQEYCEEIKKVVEMVQSLSEDSLMATYAVQVETLCKDFLNCEISSCKDSLFDGCDVMDVDVKDVFTIIPPNTVTDSTTSENEPFPRETLETALERLINHGTFKHIHPKGKEKEGYLYYSPNSLPYNKTAPLRNTVPYLPIEVNEKGVHVSNIIRSRYVNQDLYDYIEGINETRTAEQVEEIQFIKENLQFDCINKNLMMLGSVLEDDSISLSSDDEVETPSKSASDSDEYIPHYPPRTLKEIYSLPHKNRGDMKEGLTVTNDELEEARLVIAKNELLSEEDLEALLQERKTANSDDMDAKQCRIQFLSDIGWLGKADKLKEVFNIPSDSKDIARLQAEIREEAGGPIGLVMQYGYESSSNTYQKEKRKGRGNRQVGHGGDGCENMRRRDMKTQRGNPKRNGM